MTVRLKHFGGSVAIYDSTNEAAFTDPANNLDDVFFHSDLDYLQIVEHAAVSVTLPARDSGDAPWWEGGNPKTKYYYNTHDIHTAGSEFLFVLARTGKNSLGGSYVSDISGLSWRTVSLCWSGSTVRLLEQSRVTGGLPSKTLPIDLYYIGVSGPISGEPALKMSGGSVTAGHGKFSSDRRYLRKANTVEEDFFLYANDRSIDMHLSGARFIDGDDQIVDFNGYAGSWFGGERIGVLS